MNKLYFGDCLDLLKDFYKQHPKGFIDLIYIDPPFNSKRNYNILFEDAKLKDAKAQKEAFADTWSNVSYKDTLEQIKGIDLNLFSFLHGLDKINIPTSAVSYLTTMSIRLWYMHKLLKDTGSFYLHCDPTMSHYLKIVCDLIFGNKNYRNEIIWHYRRWTGGAKAFMKMHDVIFFYAKNKEKLKFNVLYTDYTEKSLKRKQHHHTRIKGNDIYVTKIDKRGVRENDVWHVQLLNSQSKERLGYPTQKPEELLGKIIKASTNEEDIVADFFCGCGTTINVAHALKRKWIGVDISHLAIGLIERRLIKSFGVKVKKTYIINGLPKDIASAKQLASGIDKGRLKFQDWIIEVMIGGVCNPKKTADGGWDGHLTFEGFNKQELVLVEVKSGIATMNDMRAFIKVINGNDASIGVFVCFKEKVTRGMIKESKDEGYYNKESLSDLCDKIQIITVEDLLEGKNIKIPQVKKTTLKIDGVDKQETFF